MAFPPKKVSSSSTGLRFTREVDGQPGVLPGEQGNPGVPVWRELEPNSYDDFGPELTTTARSPITRGRQRKKGRVTDLDASGGFQVDFTGDNMVPLLPSFMFAEWRKASTRDKIASVVGASERFARQGAFGSGFATGDLIFASGFALDANNGLKRVTGTNTDYLTVAENLLDESATFTPADLEGYVFNVTIEADADNGYGTDVEISYTAVAGDDIDDVGAALAALLGAHTPAVTATYTTATNVLQIASTENAGASVITASVVDPDGFTIATMAPTIGATGMANTSRDIDWTAAASPVSYVEYGMVQRVGVQTAAGDIDVDASDPTAPALTSTTLDFTTLGIIPGKWLFIGGDTSATRFTNAVNNGFVRAKTVAANRLTLDKTQNVMITEANTTQTVRLFFGDMIKNESDPDLIKVITHQFERSIGVGYEYLKGAHGNELTVNMETADKITVDLAFVAFDGEPQEQRKPGLFPDIRTATEAFNTTSDVVRIRASKQGSAAPLFGYVQSMSVNINNNIEPLKAIGVLGAFDADYGDFEVSGDITAYFNDVESVMAVRRSDSLTIDFTLAFDNQGWVFDIPLFTGNNGLLSVEKDSPVTIPLGMDAAEHEVLHTTLIACWFPYLPSVAMP